MATAHPDVGGHTQTAFWNSELYKFGMAKPDSNTLSPFEKELLSFPFAIHFERLLVFPMLPCSPSDLPDPNSVLQPGPTMLTCLLILCE